MDTQNTQREIEEMMKTLEQGGAFVGTDPSQREYVRKRLQNIANTAIDDFRKAIDSVAKTTEIP